MRLIIALISIEFLFNMLGKVSVTNIVFVRNDPVAVLILFSLHRQLSRFNCCCKMYVLAIRELIREIPNCL